MGAAPNTLVVESVQVPCQIRPNLHRQIGNGRIRVGQIADLEASARRAALLDMVCVHSANPRKVVAKGRAGIRRSVETSNGRLSSGRSALKHNASEETSPSFLPNIAALHEESVSRSRSNLRPKKDKQYVHVRVQQSEGEHADGPEDDGHA